jgi:D-lactate dehydrogenase (cytochrome)
MDAINTAGIVDHPYPVKDTLFFKIQGDHDCIKRTAQVVEAIVVKNGSTRFEFAATDEEAENLWQNRKYALTATLSSYPNYQGLITDVWYALEQEVYYIKD